MPEGQEVSSRSDYIIQTMICNTVFQFCPSCYIYSYVLLLSSAEVAIFMLLTCSRNYWILLYVIHC